MVANSEITLELCTNNEALREYCGLSLNSVADGMENEAADAFYGEFASRLESAGYQTERAKGQRALCHGWNGANTFAHKLGAAGTFDELTAEQQDEIQKIQSEVAKEIIAQFAD